MIRFVRPQALALGALCALAIATPAHAAVVSYDFSTGAGGFSPEHVSNAPPFTYNASLGQWQVGGATVANVSRLNAPTFTVTDGGPVSVAFSHLYNFEAARDVSDFGYDGAQLRVSVNGGAEQLVGTTLGQFVQGGYGSLISSVFGNPIAGQHAWSGNSGGVLDSMAELGTFAVGTTLAFSWLAAWDGSVSRPSPNWAIQSITLSDGQTGAAVPLPGTLPLVLLALAGCGFAVSRRPAASAGA